MNALPSARPILFTRLPDAAQISGPAVGAALLDNGLDMAALDWRTDVDAPRAAAECARVLNDRSPDGWVVLGSDRDFADPSIRYGLSSAVARMNTRTGAARVFLIGIDTAPAPASLPTLLRRAHVLSAARERWGAVVAATLFKPIKPGSADFRLAITGPPEIGQWFEVGPAEGIWEGAWFGVDTGATIDAHGVGPAGDIPRKTTLEYAVAGVQAQSGELAMTANGVRNTLDTQTSYFVRVTGQPERIVFGAYPQQQDPDMATVDLQ